MRRIAARTVLGMATGLLVAGAAHGQRFQALYGSEDIIDEAYDIEAVADRDAYISNGYTTQDLEDFFVVRKDGAGNVLWSNRYGAFNVDGAPANDRGYSVFPDVLSNDGYYLAGLTNAQPPQAVESRDIMIVGVDETGSLRFSRQYIGTGFTDPVHDGRLQATFTPGVSLLQSREQGDLYVTAHNAQSGLRPMLLRTDGFGGFVLAAEYVFPQLGEGLVAFTDIVELPPNVPGNTATYAVSGSVLRPTGERDVVLMLTDPQLNPLVVRVYDALTVKEGAQFPASATGHGITFDPGTNLVAIAGVTDLGVADPAFAPFSAPHVLTLDPLANFAVVNWTVFDPTGGAPFEPGVPLPTWETDYASVRALSNADEPRVVVGGTFFDPDGLRQAAAFVTDVFGGLRWSRGYVDESVGRSAVRALDCGVAVGGTFVGVPGAAPANPFAPAAELLVKTNDAGDAACFDPEVRLVPFPIDFEAFAFEAVPNFLDGDNDLITDPIQTGDGDAICFDPDCEPICPGDINGDNKVDGSDLVILLGNFGMMLPGGASVGDFDNSGTVDGADLVFFLANFGRMCP